MLSTNDITTGGNYHFINEGDYAYEIDKSGNLKIYKFISTKSAYRDWDKQEFDTGLTTALITEETFFSSERELSTCSFAAYNGFIELAKNVGSFSYDR